MAKSDAERSAEWRRRLLLKSSIFDDLNAERAARIRQAFPDDDRPEVRAVVEFFANYPRCQNAPGSILLQNGTWFVHIEPSDSVGFEVAAAKLALSESTSLPVRTYPHLLSNMDFDRTRDEVAEMRALGLWGRP